MAKVEMQPSRWMYPRPTLLVGANVKGRPDFMTVGGGGVANADPPMVGVPIRHHQYTLKGILENFTFSVNTPSSGMVKETDYCGIKSGSRVDKAADCGFKVFYGKLSTAPMIEQCPLNLECKVVTILNLGIHAFVIGEVKATFISQDCLSGGVPDVNKMKPMVFNLETREYSSIGAVIAKAFSAGREFRPLD